MGQGTKSLRSSPLRGGVSRGVRPSFDDHEPSLFARHVLHALAADGLWRPVGDAHADGGEGGRPRSFGSLPPASEARQFARRAGDIDMAVAEAVAWRQVVIDTVFRGAFQLRQHPFDGDADAVLGAFNTDRALLGNAPLDRWQIRPFARIVPKGRGFRIVARLAVVIERASSGTTPTLPLSL
jgi:hypothetical protein